MILNTAYLFRLIQEVSCIAFASGMLKLWRSPRPRHILLSNDPFETAPVAVQVFWVPAPPRPAPPRPAPPRPAPRLGVAVAASWDGGLYERARRQPRADSAALTEPSCGDGGVSLD